MNNSVSVEIKNEDKKKFKGFLLVLLISFIGGGFLGGSLAVCSSFGVVDAVVKPVLNIFLKSSVYANLIMAVLVLISVFIILSHSKKMIQEWDQEDDIMYSKINYNLSTGLIITYISQILSFCFFSAGILEMQRNQEVYRTEIYSHICFWAGFFGILIVVLAFQQKIINLVKVICPEKKGSIFDSKFQREWIASCDEAEKLIIYESSYTSFKIVSKACIVLWIISILGIMFMDSGIYPTIVITVIWLCSTVSYCLKSMQLEKKH